MNKRLFFLITFIIIILIFGTGFYIFSKYFSSKEDVKIDIPTKKVYVEAIDARTNEKIAINYTLMSNKTQILKGRTNVKGLEEILIPQDLKLLEFYIDDNDYYRDLNGLIGNKITIEARPIGNINLNYIGELNSTEGIIKLYIETDYENRELSMCVSWTQNIIEVYSKSYIEIKLLTNEIDCLNAGEQWIDEEVKCGFWCKIRLLDKEIIPSHCSKNTTSKLPPTFLEDRVDRCYYIQKTITKDEPLNFDLYYKAYPNINERDQLIIYLIDSNNDYYNVYRFEDENGKDFGAKTQKYIIKGSK